MSRGKPSSTIELHDVNLHDATVPDAPIRSRDHCTELAARKETGPNSRIRASSCKRGRRIRIPLARPIDAPSATAIERPRVDRYCAAKVGRDLNLEIAVNSHCLVFGVLGVQAPTVQIAAASLITGML